VIAASWLAVAAAASEVTIPAVRDNTLFEDASGSLSNGAGPVLFAGNNGQDLARRALLRFDVAGSVPAGATVHDVLLTLNVSNATNTIPRAFTLHRLLRDWGEGASSTTSGSGAPATTNDATWLHCFHPGPSLWDAPGGDFIPTASATQTITGVGVYTWTDAGMVADVQAWLDQPAANFGWLIQSDEVTLNTARRFDSRENGVAANRPALAISYTTTVDVPTPTAPGGVGMGPCRPNPTAGVSRIAFRLPAATHVRLDVVDLAGRRIGTLMEADLGPGRHESEWNGRDEHGAKAPAGVYFVRLIATGRGTLTRRLVLIP
jgi:hypothetical protein